MQVPKWGHVCFRVVVEINLMMCNGVYPYVTVSCADGLQLVCIETCIHVEYDSLSDTS